MQQNKKDGTVGITDFFILYGAVHSATAPTCGVTMKAIPHHRAPCNYKIPAAVQSAAAQPTPERKDKYHLCSSTLGGKYLSFFFLPSCFYKLNVVIV